MNEEQRKAIGAVAARMEANKPEGLPRVGSTNRPNPRVGRTGKYICKNDEIVVNGVDVSDYVERVVTIHQVGELIKAEITFQGVRAEYLGDGRTRYHLVERDG